MARLGRKRHHGGSCDQHGAHAATTVNHPKAETGIMLDAA
jgi:hypothetical protein